MSVHGDGTACEIAFMTPDGRTVVIETLLAGQAEPASGEYVLRVRKHAAV